MTVVEVVTHVNAPRTRCFDLARSVDAHMQSASTTSETVVAGRTSGMLALNEDVTWQARHFDRGVPPHRPAQVIERSHIVLDYLPAGGGRPPLANPAPVAEHLPGIGREKRVAGPAFPTLERFE